MGRDTATIADFDTTRLCPRPDLGAALAGRRGTPPAFGHPARPPARVRSELSDQFGELLAVLRTQVYLVLLAVKAKRKAPLLPVGNHFVVVVARVCDGNFLRHLRPPFSRRKYIPLTRNITVKKRSGQQ